jgi:hypothetical protein
MRQTASLAKRMAFAAKPELFRRTTLNARLVR